MSDKRKVKEILKKTAKQKKKVAVGLSKKMDKNQRLFSILVPIFAGVLFLIFSILNLSSSIWFDESYSAYLIRGDFGQIWDMTAQDVHPPLFYFALKIWSSIFGTSDVALRFMSVFFGLIAIVFIFHLVKKWFGMRAASLSTIFVAISPMFIRFGQEMRMYTMVLAIAAIATYVLTLALEMAADKRGRKYWAIYAILISAGMWTHYFSAFMWLAHVVMIVVHFGGIKKIIDNKKLFRTIIFTYAFAVLLYLPWIPRFFTQIGSVQGGFWIPPISFSSMADFFTSVLFFNKAQEVTGWGFAFGVTLVVFFILALITIFRKASAKNKKYVKYASILVVVPFLIMTILSLPPLTSTFVDRYILYSIVALWALFGIVAVLLKSGLLKNLLIVTVFIVASFGVVFVENREPRGYVKEILAETFVAAEAGEPIIADGVWIYYDGIFYSSDEHPIYLFDEDVNYEYGSLEPIRNYHYNVVDSKEDFLKDKKSVWFVTDTPAAGSKVKIPEWAEEMRVVSEISLDHHIALRFTTE